MGKGESGVGEKKKKSKEPFIFQLTSGMVGNFYVNSPDLDPVFVFGAPLEVLHKICGSSFQI